MSCVDPAREPDAQAANPSSPTPAGTTADKALTEDPGAARAEAPEAPQAGTGSSGDPGGGTSVQSLRQPGPASGDGDSSGAAPAPRPRGRAAPTGSPGPAHPASVHVNKFVKVCVGSRGPTGSRGSRHGACHRG
jgi:hypothetical protein